ncbi:GAF domain-containing protein [Burkholderiaceae bacterium DAT-1]|nr:GAF domain-containing protein [Burkholderiaceae bacterium DAT-1]
MHDANLVMNLYKLLADGKLDKPKFCQMLVRALVQESGSSRASIWWYSGELRDEIVCQTLFDTADNAWVDGAVLREDEYPEYFQAMLGDRRIVAPDARNHPACMCFNENFQEPLNIYSRVDMAIGDQDAELGILTCEMAGSPKIWTDTDVLFIQQVAAMIAMGCRKGLLN